MRIALDTETTGIDSSTDEILELAIVDEEGNTLFNSRFKNVVKKSWTGASKVNGIYPKDLKNEKPLAEYQQEIQDILNAADEIIGYNVYFDVSFLSSAGFEVYHTLQILRN